MKNTMNKFFRFSFTGETLAASVSALAMIVFSFLMVLFNGNSLTDKIMSFILRDLFMIFGLGIFFISLYAGRNGESVLKSIGFSGRKFVGLMYCSVFFITQNLLIVFPFFWGVGALWDVIVSSESGDEIKNLESFVIALVILALSLIWVLILNFIKRGKK